MVSLKLYLTGRRPRKRSRGSGPVRFHFPPALPSPRCASPHAGAGSDSPARTPGKSPADGTDRRSGPIPPGTSTWPAGPSVTRSGRSRNGSRLGPAAAVGQQRVYLSRVILRVGARPGPHKTQPSLLAPPGQCLHRHTEAPGRLRCADPLTGSAHHHTPSARFPCTDSICDDMLVMQAAEGKDRT